MAGIRSRIRGFGPGRSPIWNERSTPVDLVLINGTAIFACGQHFTRLYVVAGFLGQHDARGWIDGVILGGPACPQGHDDQGQFSGIKGSHVARLGCLDLDYRCWLGGAAQDHR